MLLYSADSKYCRTLTQTLPPSPTAYCSNTISPVLLLKSQDSSIFPCSLFQVEREFHFSNWRDSTIFLEFSRYFKINNQQPFQFTRSFTKKTPASYITGWFLCIKLWEQKLKVRLQPVAFPSGRGSQCICSGYCIVQASRN